MNFIRSQTVNFSKLQRYKQDDEIEKDEDLDEAYEEEEDVIDEDDEEN